MLSACRIVVWATLLGAALGATSLPQDFGGELAIVPDSQNVTCVTKDTAECTPCINVCNAVFTCLGTATLVTTGLASTVDDGDNKYGLITGTGADCPVQPFEATVTRPQPQAAVVPKDIGALVQPSAAAAVTMRNGATFFVNRTDFQDNLVQGSMVGQCDGLTLRISPGGLCDCSADFQVTQGAVMTVSASQPAYSPAAAAPTPVGGLYLLRVKENAAPDDFRICNSTLMGNFSRPCVDRFGDPCNGLIYTQCLRNLTVQSELVTRYKIATCGTQLRFFNRGGEENQESPSCRDGLGVVSDLGGGVQGIQTPAGVLRPRNDNQQLNTTDRQWFFTLTPAQSPRDPNAQFDLGLTLLTDDGGTWRQLQCIAEAKVDSDGNKTVTPGFLGATFSAIVPSGALPVSLSILAGVLCALLMLL